MQLVANLGFPAIVTMYLLVRIEGKLESLSMQKVDNIKLIEIVC